VRALRTTESTDNLDTGDSDPDELENDVLDSDEEEQEYNGEIVDDEELEGDASDMIVSDLDSESNADGSDSSGYASY
jgi:hypothetical protein